MHPTLKGMNLVYAVCAWHELASMKRFAVKGLMSTAFW